MFLFSSPPYYLVCGFIGLGVFPCRNLFLCRFSLLKPVASWTFPVIHVKSIHGLQIHLLINDCSSGPEKDWKLYFHLRYFHLLIPSLTFDRALRTNNEIQSGVMAKLQMFWTEVPGSDHKQWTSFSLTRWSHVPVNCAKPSSQVKGSHDKLIQCVLHPVWQEPHTGPPTSKHHPPFYLWKQKVQNLKHVSVWTDNMHI